MGSTEVRAREEGANSKDRVMCFRWRWASFEERSAPARNLRSSSDISSVFGVHVAVVAVAREGAIRVHVVCILHDLGGLHWHLFAIFADLVVVS